MKEFSVSPALSGTLLVAVGILAIFFPFFYLAGNIFPFNLAFWFIGLPFLAAVLPLIVRKERNHFKESMSGLMLFYLFMVWMLYKQYESEYFMVIMVSAAFNILLLSVIALSRWVINKQQSAN